MSKSNQTRHIELPEAFKCKCKLDSVVCNRCECKELID